LNTEQVPVLNVSMSICAIMPAGLAAKYAASQQSLDSDDDTANENGESTFEEGLSLSASGSGSVCIATVAQHKLNMNGGPFSALAPSIRPVDAQVQACIGL
jgi:hypothetical protein